MTLVSDTGVSCATCILSILDPDDVQRVSSMGSRQNDADGSVFSTPEDVSMIMKFSSNAPIIHVSANTNPALSIQAVIAISNKHDFSVNKYNSNASSVAPQTYPESPQAAPGQQTQLPISMDTILGTFDDE